MAQGFYRENFRWLGAGFGLSLASSFGQTFFISLFAGDIRAAYGLSDGDWGAIYTGATLASAALLFRLGGLADTMRLDRLAVAVLAGYAAAAVGMALSQSVAVLAVLVFALRFCGQGMMSHLAITSMGRWFRAHRGKAVAFAGLGFSAGEALLPALAVALAGIAGWRSAWLAVAAVLALVAAPALAWALSARRQPRGAAESHDATAGLGGRHWTRSEVLGHWTFWALLPGVLTAPFIGTVIFFQQVHIAAIKGWDLGVMALGFPVYAALTIGASLTGGWLVDRVGAARLLPVYLLPLGAGVAVLAFAGSVEGWFMTLALCGLTQGTAQALWGALWPELYGTRNLGAVRSVATTAMVFSTAIGPGITGVLIDAGIDLSEQAPAMALWCLGLSGVLMTVLRRMTHAPRLP